MISILRTIWRVFSHLWQKRVTVQYPEEKPYKPPRYRGRIVLTEDPDGELGREIKPQPRHEEQISAS